MTGKDNISRSLNDAHAGEIIPVACAMFVESDKNSFFGLGLEFRLAAIGFEHPAGNAEFTDVTISEVRRNGSIFWDFGRRLLPADALLPKAWESAFSYCLLMLVSRL